MQKKNSKNDEYTSLRISKKLAKKLKILVATGDFRSSEALIWSLLEKQSI